MEKVHRLKSQLTSDFQEIAEIVDAGNVVIVHNVKRGRRPADGCIEYSANDMPWKITLLGQEEIGGCRHFVKTAIMAERNALANIINRGIPVVLHDGLRGSPAKGESGPRWREPDVMWLVELAMGERVPLEGIDLT